MPALHSWDQGGARGGSPAQAEELLLFDYNRHHEMSTFLERRRMRVQSIVPEKRQLFASGIHFASEKTMNINKMQKKAQHLRFQS